MSINVVRCEVDDLINSEGLDKVLAAYADECAYADLPKPSPHFDTYRLLEASGNMQAIGAWDDETLVGFAIVVCYISPHYGRVLAVTESMFMLEPHRSGRLVKAVEKVAQDRGAVGLLISAPAEGDLDQALTQPRHGYRKVAHAYLKEVEALE